MKDFTEELIFEMDLEEGGRRLCIEAEICILIKERENSLAWVEIQQILNTYREIGTVLHADIQI